MTSRTDLSSDFETLTAADTQQNDISLVTTDEPSASFDTSWRSDIDPTAEAGKAVIFCFFQFLNHLLYILFLAEL